MKNIDKVKVKKPYSKFYYQVVVFCLCFFSYGGFHISRTAWSYVTDNIIDTYAWDKTTIGHMNFIFMLGYGTGLFFNGWLVD